MLNQFHHPPSLQGQRDYRETALASQSPKVCLGIDQIASNTATALADTIELSLESLRRFCLTHSASLGPSPANCVTLHQAPEDRYLPSESQPSEGPPKSSSWCVTLSKQRCP